MEEPFASNSPVAQVAMPGCCGLGFYTIFGLVFVLGNLLSYSPLPPYAADKFNNSTLMAEYSNGTVPIPSGLFNIFVGGFFQMVSTFMLPFFAVIVYNHRDQQGITWYSQYCNTSAHRLCMIIFYVCFWGFLCHTIRLYIDNDCESCVGRGILAKVWWSSSVPALARYYPFAFWVHVVPAGCISFLAPFQLTKQVRVWNNFQAHRWIGRVVLVASCVHQASATYLTICNLFFNRNVRFQSSWAANTVYASGFVLPNVYSWTATIQGWKCAVDGRLIEHGAWMYRLCGVWAITIILFRNFQPVWSLVFGPQWGLALELHLVFLFLIPLEIYLWKSGRFDWGTTYKTVADKEISDQMRCPFSGVTENGSGEKCLLRSMGKDNA